MSIKYISVLKRYMSSGDIRRGGGKFGQKEAALENQYFRKRVCFINIKIFVTIRKKKS